MKWQARSKHTRAERSFRRRALVDRWHSRFAWTPVRIPETKYDDIVVPCHFVWLERYETRWNSPEWNRRPYGGAPTLKELVNQ